MTVTCTVTGPLSDTGIRAAFDRFVAAEPVLRLRMELDERGEVVQWFDREPPRMEIAELALPDPAPGRSEDDRVAEAVRPHLAEHFDVDGGPLARLLGLRGTDRTVLVLVAHHLLMDGVGQVALAERLMAAVFDSADPGSTERYLELVERVRADEHRAAETDRDYWAQRIGGRLGVGEWVTEADGDGPAGCVRASTSPGALARVDAVCTETGASRFQVLAGVLHRALGFPRTVVCAATSVRPRGGFTDTAGCFVNQIPLAAEHRPGESLADLVGREAPGWRADLARRHRPLLAIAHEHGSVRLDRVLTSYRPEGNEGVLVRGDGDRTVRADLFNRYYHAKSDLSVRFVPNAAGMEWEVEWAAGTPPSLGAAFAAAVRAELVG